MKIVATFHRTVESDWKVRIVPRRAPSGEYDEEIFSTWKPDKDEEMLIFNPSISLVVRNRTDRNASVSIPISLTYALESCLSAVYSRLQTKGLYTMVNNELYLDANIAEKCAVKLSIYKSHIVLIPVVVHNTTTDEMLRGIRLWYGGNFVANLRHNEVRELCEVLNHLDIQAYTMILALAERITKMDEKLDQVISSQSLILSMLKDLGATKIKTTPPIDGMQWRPAEF